MNLADSVKKVLKNKSQLLFQDFWKEDLKTLALDMGQDISRMGQLGLKSIKGLKSGGSKVTFRDAVDSAADTLTVFKILPKRFKQGFSLFKEEFVKELDLLPDQKQKTVFSLKVIGALTSFTLGAFYSVKKGKSELFLTGLRRRSPMIQLIIAEIIFKMGQLFLLRFLSAIEEELSGEGDLKNIRYFKRLLSDRKRMEQEANNLETPDTADKSFQLIQNLKNYILTGK